MFPKTLEHLLLPSHRPLFNPSTNHRLRVATSVGLRRRPPMSLERSDSSTKIDFRLSTRLVTENRMPSSTTTAKSNLRPHDNHRDAGVIVACSEKTALCFRGIVQSASHEKQSSTPMKLCKGKRTRALAGKRKLRSDPIPVRSNLNEILSQKSGDITPFL